MKRVLPKLTLGDRIEARVTEVLDAQTLIVSFNGDLSRISNESTRSWQAGDSATLQVTAVAPLAFKLVDSPAVHRSRRLGHIDFTV